MPQKRIRINVATSVKGVKTWDATAELIEDSIEGPDLEMVTLALSDWLVAELEKRYPAVID